MGRWAEGPMGRWADGPKGRSGNCGVFSRGGVGTVAVLFGMFLIVLYLRSFRFSDSQAIQAPLAPAGSLPGSSNLKDMPVIVVSDVDAQKAVDEAPTDLAWILSDCEVNVHLQGVIIHSGFDRIKRFIGLGETRAEVKGALLSHLGLDPAESLAMRVQVASILSAWETAKDHITKESSAKMEAKAAGCVRPVGQTEHQAMRKSYEAQWGKLRNDECPSRSYLGYKNDEVEENEPKAESLKEVHAKDEPEQDFLSTAISVDGQIKVRKGSMTSKEPDDPEQLRAKWKLISACWLFLKLKHTNRAWLSDLSPKVFQDAIDYILGRKVYGLRCSSSDARQLGNSPSWIMLLNFELEFRKKVYDLVTADGLNLGAAIVRTCDDQNLVTMHLVTPMTLATRSTVKLTPKWGDGPPADVPAWSPKKKARGNGNGGGSPGGKGGKGGGGKGGGKIDGKKLKSKHNGRDICYKYNNDEAGNPCDGSCGRLHICQVCLKDNCKAASHR